MEWLFGKITELQEKEYSEIYSKLSPSRKAHIDRLKTSEARKRSLLGEGLCRRLLENKGIEAEIERAEGGKPYLKNCPYYISISHSDEVVAAAISAEPVGIDIERLRPVSEKLIKRAALKHEADYIMEASGEERDRRFFEIWTMKEALFKKSETNRREFLSIDTKGKAKEIFLIEDYLITIV